MARASARVRNPSEHAGLIDNAIGLISALFGYVETRAALLAARIQDSTIPAGAG